MSTAEMKLELHKKIDGLDDEQLEEVYSVFQDYMNNDDDEWDEPISLAEIDEAIKDAGEGKGRPLEDVIGRLRSKHDLHG